MRSAVALIRELESEPGCVHRIDVRVSDMPNVEVVGEGEPGERQQESMWHHDSFDDERD